MKLVHIGMKLKKGLSVPALPGKRFIRSIKFNPNLVSFSRSDRLKKAPDFSGVAIIQTKQAF